MPVTARHDGRDVTSPMHPGGEADAAELDSPPMEDVDLDSPPHAADDAQANNGGRGLSFLASDGTDGGGDGKGGGTANCGRADTSPGVSAVRPPQLSIDATLDICGTGVFQWRLLLIAGLAFAGDAVEVKDNCQLSTH